MIKNLTHIFEHKIYRAVAEREDEISYMFSSFLEVIFINVAYYARQV